ncbi:hypothetical protein EV174_004303 [Coemansia sp. RSA 2320]|nr:hypothetical protein EV174_004303 [Coemansia sp. RSA 2320]
MHWARTIQRNNKLKALADGKNSSSPEISRRSAVVAAILQQQQEPPGTCQTPDASAASVDVPWSDSQDARLDRAEGRPLLVPFSAEEDQMIMRLTRQYGRKWTLIARLITASHQQKLVDGGDGSTSQAAIIRTGLNVQTRHSIIGKRHGKAASKGTAEAERGDPERIGAAQKQAKPARRVNQIWTPEEDAALVRIVEAMMEEEAGFSSWNEVARQMPTDRTNRQCRTRWMLNVGTHLQHTAFTEAEDKLLWPFVVDSEQRPLRTRGRKEFSGKPIAINYAQGDDEAPAFVGIGWFGARRMTGRSSGSLKCRICRLQHIIEWLGKVAGVKDAHLQFDLVHRLANTPSDFRIISRNINKAEAVKEKI